MNLSSPSAALWLVTITVQAAALFLAHKRKQPELATFLGYKLVKSLALVAVLDSAGVYQRVYQIGVVLNPLFAFWLLHGIFRQVFSTSIIRHFVAKMLASAVVACTLVLPGYTWWVKLDLAVAVVSSATLLLLVGYANALGMHWRHHMFGIACGFWMYTTVSVMTAALLSRPHSTVAPDYINRIAWLLMLVTWCGHLCVPLKDSIIPTHEQLNELKKTVNSVRALKSQLSRKTA
jgi:hypothetical protein